MAIDRGRVQLQGTSRTLIDPISTIGSSVLRSEVESAGLATNAVSTKAESNMVRPLGSQTGAVSRVSMESAAAVVAKPYLPAPSAQQPIALRAESTEREQLRTSDFEVGNHQLVVEATTLKTSKLAGTSSQSNLIVATKCVGIETAFLLQEIQSVLHAKVKEQGLTVVAKRIGDVRFLTVDES